MDNGNATPDEAASEGGRHSDTSASAQAIVREARAASLRRDWPMVVRLWRKVLTRWPSWQETAEQHLMDACRKLEMTDEVSMLMSQYADRVRGFDLTDVLARCLPEVQHLTSDQITTEYPSRSIANTSRYHCIHTIASTGEWAGEPPKIFEKCILLSSQRNQLIAARSALLKTCVDFSEVPAPRFLHEIQQDRHCFLFFEFCDGNRFTRRQFRERYFRKKDKCRFDVIGLAAAVTRAPVDRSRFEQSGKPVSFIESRQAGKSAGQAKRDLLEEAVQRFFEGDQRKRAMEILDSYHSRINDIDSFYARLPKVLCHGDLAPRNILRSHGNKLFVIDWDMWGLEPAGADLAILSHLRVTDHFDGQDGDVYFRVFQDIVREYQSRAGVSASEDEVRFAAHQYWIALRLPELTAVTDARDLKLLLSYMHEVVTLLR